MNQIALNILYEDTSIIVCKKNAGIATQTKQVRTPDLESLIKRHLYQAEAIKTEPYLAVIHRLDQPVSGILVFAKTPEAAKILNQQLQTKQFGKHYKALLTSPPPNTSGKLINYMKKDGKNNTSQICSPEDPQGKKGILNYQIIATPCEEDWNLFEHCNITDRKNVTYVQITLETGRHHQIRLQMATLGCSIWGDTKYGYCAEHADQWQNIALCAYKLEFNHPVTGLPLLFEL